MRKNTAHPILERWRGKENTNLQLAQTVVLNLPGSEGKASLDSEELQIGHKAGGWTAAIDRLLC